MHQSKIRELKIARDKWRREAARWDDRAKGMTGELLKACERKLKECKDQIEAINRDLGRHV